MRTHPSETTSRPDLPAAGRLLLLAVALSVAGACASLPEVPVGPDGTVDPVLVEGRRIFGGTCSGCHGSDGSGGRGPDLRDVVARYPDPAAQLEVVSAGRDRMPGFGGSLSDAELEAVVRYTREVL